MDKVRFNQKPIQKVYQDFHTGEIKTVRRRPPQRFQDVLPTDVVELNFKKNDDFDAGDEFKVKHISYRAPNTLQLVNEDGGTTFVSSADINVTEKNGFRGVEQVDDENANRYLTWP